MFSILKKIVKIISILIALVLFLSALVFVSFNYLNSPPFMSFPYLPFPSAEYNNDLKVEGGNILFLEVRNGESALSVGKRLEEAGIIRSNLLWRVICKLKNEHIKTGSYRIELPASQLHIHTLLVSGEQILVRVTIPEGVTLKKISRVLEEAGICKAEEFLIAAASRSLKGLYNIPGETLEGYLYPDTYLFPLNFPAERAARAMVDTFFSRLAEMAPEALGLGSEELNNRVIIASIVEREYRIAEEAALMAGVFYNRLKINMALQSCATVEYIITEIQGRPHPELLYNRDLEIRDPYNTYLRPGLPPGPICVPGSVALLASFNPAPSDYFYFRLTDPSAGRHFFSRTLDEHIRAGALYLKGNP
jgi:UPF0755 protein